MSRNLWFALGFAAAWLLIAALLVAPIWNTRASRPLIALGSTPTAAALPTAVARPEPTPSPEPTIVLPALAWWRQSSLSGKCQHLEIDAAGELRYAPCDQGSRLAHLTASELRTYQKYVSRFAPFDYAVQQERGQLGTIRLEFVGQGGEDAPLEQQSEVAQWAESVFERLAGQELREDLVANARVHLAFLLDQPVDKIETVAVSEEIWSDACLGISREGLFCAQVLTPGYRIVLALDAASYEYRSDLHGTIHLATDPAPQTEGS